MENTPRAVKVIVTAYLSLPLSLVLLQSAGTRPSLTRVWARRLVTGTNTILVDEPLVSGHHQPTRSAGCHLFLDRFEVLVSCCFCFVFLYFYVTLINRTYLNAFNFALKAYLSHRFIGTDNTFFFFFLSTILFKSMWYPSSVAQLYQMLKWRFIDGHGLVLKTLNSFSRWESLGLIRSLFPTAKRIVH